MYSVPNGRHQNTPRDKVPPSLRTDICAHAHVPHVPHVPSWHPRTRPVAPSSVLPFPSQAHDRFSFRPSPFLFLPVLLPSAYPFLQQSSSYLPLLLEIFASQPPIAYSRARLLAQLICNIATANHPPSSLAYITLSPPIPPPPGTFVSHHPRNSSPFAYPLLATGRAPRTEPFISDREQYHTATIVCAYTVEDLVSTLPPADRCEITSGKKVTVCVSL